MLSKERAETTVSLKVHDKQQKHNCFQKIEFFSTSYTDGQYERSCGSEHPNASPHIVNGRSCPQIAHIDLSPAAAVGSRENCSPTAAPIPGEMEKPNLQHMTTHSGCALIIWVLPSDQFFFPSLSLT